MTQIELSGVAETAMWTLYTRANEAQRPDGVLKDPQCVELFEAIDYPYESKFGKDQTGLHGEKSRIFDTVVRSWLAENPSGTIVELGAGLETQFHRLDNGTVSWVCVDLHEVIAVRGKFLAPNERCRYIAADACDVSWFDQVEPGPVLVTAQSFLMFLQEEQARQLLVAIIDRFPGVEIVFDTISPAISQKMVNGYKPTENYEFPPAPWGIKWSDVAPLLHRWHAGISKVEVQSFGAVHGILNVVKPLFLRVPPLRGMLPAVAHLKT
ncbi:class I SAM-dependent methyltransferase [Mycobacteroides immunogenum]|uniref:Methyltransferase n=1 Tax=Mycobacteroides immunogenum TaxID=83262 RepID=A0A7V8RUJ7_9MYCO|nr:class I SAM-dependent methyltransferase [Mycobacteroides immunogenum]AMT70908.1 methyltransferase [Mycobacteroides immunogenum]ANO04016.1 methyltransferase [Mycobacteroides immunogenum]KIU39495.1 methyltransferase [Mycobacteroides immunogenum]KPG03970.1 methyltransferase [Mycobacteroides immunogenum]KPG04451.1 methyltransferase [Mycobacteroides immunogenum]